MASPSAGATPKQPIIGSRASDQSRERGRGIDQAHRFRCDVDRPFGGLPFRQARRPIGVDDVRGQWVASPPDLARRGEPDDCYFERVAGHCTLDPDGTALRIGRLSSVRSRAIDSEGVERLHDDGIARLHAESGRVLAHGVEESLGIEMVRGHAVSSMKSEAGRAGIVASEVVVRRRSQSIYAIIAIL